MNGSLDFFGVGFDLVRDVFWFSYGFFLALLGEWFYLVMAVAAVLMLLIALTLLKRLYLWAGRSF